MVTKHLLGKLQKVNIRQVWANEATDFTPWLAHECIQLLSDAIGIDLEVEATEKVVGPFRADILCKDTATGNWVLVENQLERTDHTHLGQLVTYAAGLKAATIIWIASRFTDEHRAAIDWLNEITSSDFNFFALEVEAWQIGDSPIAPKFNIVSAPNNWSQNVMQAKKQVEQGELSPVQQLQLEFWTGFREYVVEKSSIIKPTKPLPQGWMSLSIGRSGFNIVAVASTQDPDTLNLSGHHLRVEFLAIDDPDKNYFNQLANEKVNIESEYGSSMNWAPSPGIKQSKVFVKCSANIDDRDKWPDYHTWLMENLERFHAIFSKRVKLLSSTSTDSSAE